MNKKIKLSDILTELQKMGKCCINEKLPIDADKLIELSIEGFDNVIHTLKQLSEPNKFKILLLLYKKWIITCLCYFLCFKLRSNISISSFETS
jgi:hypothetical protein